MIPTKETFKPDNSERVKFKRTHGEHGHNGKNNNHKCPARNRYKNSTLLLPADLEQFPEPIRPLKVILTRSRTKAVTN